MWPMIALALLGADEPVADARPEPEFRIEVRIVEFEPIEGVTRQHPNSRNHLHVEPSLVITAAETASVKKRGLRGPTIGTKETGFEHYPRLVVDIELTREAKLRLKAALAKVPLTTSKRRVIATVINGQHDGSWSKYFFHDPTFGDSYWKNWSPRIGCTSDEPGADRLIEYLTPPKATPSE